MSRSEYRGSAWAVQQLMEEAQYDIDRGERQGVTWKYREADQDKVHLGWLRANWLRGAFKRKAAK